MRETVPANRDLRPDGDVRLTVDSAIDLRMVLGVHQRGRGDPAMRFEASGSCWRASRTPEGPVTLLIERIVDPAGVRVRAWGPGAAWAVAQAPALLGLDDEPASVMPSHPAVIAALRKVGPVRLGRSERVMDALIPAILEQKVTGEEARRAYRGLIARWGEPAPGPPGLRLVPPPEVIARLPYHALHPVGIERRRAELLAAVCRDAARLEALGAAAAVVGAAAAAGVGAAAAAVVGAAAAAGVGAAPAGVGAAPGALARARAAAYAALVAYPGIGPWTAAEVGLRAFGDPDAVSVGDFHLPNMVAWALAREPRGTDERMLELLEPYAGQRGRVVRLLELAGTEAPKYGPRLSPRRIERL